MKFLYLTLILGILLSLSFVSAWLPVLNENNDLKKDLIISDNANKYSAISIDDWLGIGKTLMTGVITEHTSQCGTECYSIMDINIAEDSSLIDNVKFYTLKLDEDGKEISREEQPIRKYQFYIQDGIEDKEVKDYEYVCIPTGRNLVNGTEEVICNNQIIGSHIEEKPIWKPYSLDEILPKGEYIVKIEGNKRPDRTVDWQIETQGKWITDWATWGTGTEYVEVSGINLTGSGSTASTYGVRIQANANLNITKMSKDPQDTSTNCYLKNMSSYLLNSSTFVGNDCNLRYSLLNGVQYRIYTDSGGSSRTLKSQHSPGFPKIGANGYITYVDGIDSVDSGTDDMYSYVNITVTIGYGSTLKLNSPTNYLNTSSSSVIFNCSANAVGANLVNMSVWTNTTGTFKINQTLTSSGTSDNKNFTIINTPDGNYIWTCQGCDTDGDCGMANENRTISIDATPPNITLIYPTGIIDTLTQGQNLSLNYTINDTNLGACWKEYNSTNTTISCTSNSSFIYEKGINSIKVWANDTFGNLNYTQNDWKVSLITNSITYNSQAVAQSPQPFTINITYDNSAYTGLGGNLIYNNTAYPLTISSLSGNNALLSNSINALQAATGTNATFYFNILLTNSTASKSINSTSYNQTIISLSLDDCSSYTIRLANFTLKDEQTQNVIQSASNPLIKVDLSLYPYNSTDIPLSSINKSFGNSSAAICSNVNISGQYRLDGVVQYSANESQYVSEFYYFQKQEITNTTIPLNVSLYDLDTTNSQEFLFELKDNNFQGAGGVLIDVMRKYIPEGVSKTVELPITDTSGKTLVHLVLSDVIYTFIFKKDGVVLGMLDEVLAKCDDVSTGQCTISTNYYTSSPLEYSWETRGGITYSQSFNQTSRTITTIFTTIGGTKTVNVTATKYDRFGNTTLCSNSITTSSGIVSCVIPDTFGNVSIVSDLYVDGEKTATALYSISDNPIDIYGYNGIILAIIIITTLSMMFITSPIGVAIAALIGLVLSSGLLLITGSSLIGVGSIFIWLIIAVIIIIVKAKKSEERQ